MQKTILLFFFLIFFSCTDDTATYKKIKGNAFGTTFDILYQNTYNQDFTKQIDSLIYVVNKSLSTYIPNSDISKINNGDSTIVVDEMFVEVFQKSNRIYKESNGLYDPTVGVLVNAWGFGPEKPINEMDSVKVKELLEFVGFDKVKIINNKIEKLHSKIRFDFNSIAKGYGLDIIGRFFESKGCENYRIELGGEVRAKGVDPTNKLWRVWLEDPNTDGTRSFNKSIQLDNQSMASSGNYRKFKIDKNGRKYVHTINAKTGFATESNLLAATVISSLDCADVDAYATAFMAMGFEKTKVFLENHQELQVYLIYVDNDGETKIYQSEDLIVKHKL
ncbi:MAG: thiamine biosynthesis protein ApbE [Lutibacter sp.]|nr:MAG: thiamine biosynthesis protein ApbE [Lutibacter sp.]